MEFSKRIIFSFFLLFLFSNQTYCCKNDTFVSQEDLSFLLRDILNSEKVDFKNLNFEIKKDKPQNAKLLKKYKKTFNKKYLEKYYPKVFVIINGFFIKMSPEFISDALHDIVDILTNRPWFYVTNKETVDITKYWEYLIDQMGFFSFFIQNAFVDKNGKIIFDWDSENEFFFFRASKKDNKGQRLLTYLNQRGLSSYQNFYALLFDYVIKMFNEGVLIKDMVQVVKYFNYLKKIIEKLQGSIYEAEYKEHIKTSKELLKLLGNEVIEKKLGNEIGEMLNKNDCLWDNIINNLAQ